jgi:hypothetical protein
MKREKNEEGHSGDYDNVDGGKSYKYSDFSNSSHVRLKEKSYYNF